MCVRCGVITFNDDSLPFTLKSPTTVNLEPVIFGAGHLKIRKSGIIIIIIIALIGK